MNKGLIALDIDGTTTEPGRPIPQEVITFLAKLVKEQWTLLFVTGRTLQWSHEIFSSFNFTYYLSVQNGAITLEMPQQKILDKKYLNQEIIPIMQRICEDEPTDFVIYAGCEHHDRCFYRPDHFSSELLEYLKARSAAFGERWQAVSSFDLLDLKEFASVKCFGLHQKAIAVAKKIERELDLHVPVIRDPFNANYYVAQATDPLVTKGRVVKDLKELLKINGPIIAAGDDYNDVAMLENADYKIVMSTAPQDLWLMADVVAPPAGELGIIKGIQTILGLYGNQRIQRDGP